MPTMCGSAVLGDFFIFMVKIFIFLLFPFSIFAQNINHTESRSSQINAYEYKESNYMSIEETKKALSFLGREFDLSERCIWMYFTAKIEILDCRNNQIQVGVGTCTCIRLNFSDGEFDKYFEKYKNKVGKEVKISGMILFKHPYSCTEFKNVRIKE